MRAAAGFQGKSKDFFKSNQESVDQASKDKKLCRFFGVTSATLTDISGGSGSVEKKNSISHLCPNVLYIYMENVCSDYEIL